MKCDEFELRILVYLIYPFNIQHNIIAAHYKRCLYRSITKISKHDQHRAVTNHKPGK